MSKFCCEPTGNFIAGVGRLLGFTTFTTHGRERTCTSCPCSGGELEFGILFFTFHGLAKFASVVFNDHFRSSDFIRPASSLGRFFLSRHPYLLKQGIEVFPLEESVVV